MAVSPSYPEAFTLALSLTETQCETRSQISQSLISYRLPELSAVHGAQIENPADFTADLHTHFVAISSFVL